eukprot:1147595-Pelagomonas_calceolata.AAC.3
MHAPELWAPQLELSLPVLQQRRGAHDEVGLGAFRTLAWTRPCTSLLLLLPPLLHCRVLQQAQEADCLCCLAKTHLRMTTSTNQHGQHGQHVLPKMKSLCCLAEAHPYRTQTHTDQHGQHFPSMMNILDVRPACSDRARCIVLYHTQISMVSMPQLKGIIWFTEDFAMGEARAQGNVRSTLVVWWKSKAEADALALLRLEESAGISAPTSMFMPWIQTAAVTSPHPPKWHRLQNHCVTTSALQICTGGSCERLSSLPFYCDTIL